MERKSSLFIKSIVFGVIILFIGVAVQPGLATVQPEEEINLEPKDYLFETIIDIVNNPNIMNMVGSRKFNDLVYDFDYNFRGVYSKILFKNPKLFRSLIFTKPSISYEYLTKCYNYGIKITDIIGDYKAQKIIESVKGINQDFLNDINNIINNDKELSNKIKILKEMNKDYESDSKGNNTIICAILMLILIPAALLSAFYNILKNIYRFIPSLYLRFTRKHFVRSMIVISCIVLMIFLGC